MPFLISDNWAIFRLNQKSHLESEEIIYGADDDVDGRRAARLCAQVVLEICTEIFLKDRDVWQFAEI